MDIPLLTPAVVDNSIEHLVLLIGLLSGSYALWRAWRSIRDERYSARSARDRAQDDLDFLKREVTGRNGTSMRETIDRMELGLQALHQRFDDHITHHHQSREDEHEE